MHDVLKSFRMADRLLKKIVEYSMKYRHYKGSPPKNGNIIVINFFQNEYTGYNEPNKRFIGRVNARRELEAIMKDGNIYEYTPAGIHIHAVGRVGSMQFQWWNPITEEPMHIQHELDRLVKQEFKTRVKHSIKTKTADPDPIVRARVRQLLGQKTISKHGLKVPPELVEEINDFNTGGRKRTRRRRR